MLTPLFKLSWLNLMKAMSIPSIGTGTYAGISIGAAGVSFVVSALPYLQAIAVLLSIAAAVKALFWPPKK